VITIIDAHRGECVWSQQRQHRCRDSKLDLCAPSDREAVVLAMLPVGVILFGFRGGWACSPLGSITFDTCRRSTGWQEGWRGSISGYRWKREYFKYRDSPLSERPRMIT